MMSPCSLGRGTADLLVAVALHDVEVFQSQDFEQQPAQRWIVLQEQHPPATHTCCALFDGLPDRRVNCMIASRRNRGALRIGTRLALRCVTNSKTPRRARVPEDMTAEPTRSRPSTPRIVPPAKRCSRSPPLGCCSPCARSCVSPRVPRSCACSAPGPLAVGDLAAILGRSKSATSQHLRVLRDGGVVVARRRGRAVIYSLAQTPMVAAVVQMLERAASLSAA